MVNTATGEDVIDAKKSAEGLLLPIGGYKGYGLALVFGLLQLYDPAVIRENVESGTFDLRALDPVGDRELLVRVRQAVSLALDHREIIEATLEGVGVEPDVPVPGATISIRGTALSARSASR